MKFGSREKVDYVWETIIIVIIAIKLMNIEMNKVTFCPWTTSVDSRPFTRNDCSQLHRDECTFLDTISLDFNVL